MSVVSGEVSSGLDASEETRDGDEERQEDRCDGSSWFQLAAAARWHQPDELSAVMEAAFGRSDARLCRAVDAVRRYATPLRYVAPLFAAAAAEQPASLPALRRCAFDLSAACRLEPSCAGVQFLTLDAVRVSQAAFTPR